MKYAYLATPYTNEDPDIREARYREAMRITADLMKSGMVVFSPIVHSHPISLGMDNSVDHDFWMRQCMGMLAPAGLLLVAKMPGWEVSRGVKAEMQFAAERGILTEFIEP